MSPAWGRLTDFVATRDGVITWHEATSLGITEDEIRAWVRAGRLRLAAPQAYVLAGAPVTWYQRVRVAAGSGGAWASHRTSAALRVLDGFGRRQVEVVTPRGRRRKRGAWIVHESRTLRGVDLDMVDGIPTTSLVRTILDLPAVAHPYLVAKALDHACRREPGTLERIAQRHLELPRRGRRGARLMREMLGERLGWPGFGDSDFETAALRVIRSAGMPDPVMQYEVRDGGFVAHLDLAWPDIRWLVECDSLAGHSGKGPHEWDRARRRHLKRLGWDTAEITFDDVTKRAGQTGAELRELYEQRRRAVAVAIAAGHPLFPIDGDATGVPHPSHCR
jgi:hypothetical protein